MNFRFLALICILLSFWNSTFGQEKKTTPEEYIQTYKDLAIGEMKRSGVPASITLAQGLLESSNGNSRLAKEANNHFGIKCKSGWAGKSINIDDDALQECFRAYDKAEDSYNDHTDFLSGNTRYSFLFQLDATDYKGWAYGLKQAGYATNPKYPDMLIAAIEKYALYQYDAGNTKVPPQKLVDKSTEPKKSIFGKVTPVYKGITYNNIPAYIVKPGEDYGNIANNLNMMRWELRRYNDLNRDEKLTPGTIIYLKPKRRKGMEEYHVVAKGESMYFISQYRGIKLRLLYKWNRMKKGQEPETGEKLNLRYKRTEPPRLKPDGTILERRGIVPVAPPRNNSDPKPDSSGTTKNTETPKPGNIPVVGFDGKDSVGKFHITQTGETVYGISKNYTVSFSDLIQWNQISGPLHPGQKIYLTKPIVPKTTNDQEKRIDLSNEKNELDSNGRYIVKKGETLSSISRKYHVPLDSIYSYSSLQSYDIHIGQVLQIKPKTSSNTGIISTGGSGKTEFHTVTTGETLYSIARKYGLTVQQLIDMNNLPNNSLSLGQVIIIKK